MQSSPSTDSTERHFEVHQALFASRKGTGLQAKEEETSAQIAVLAAELKQMRWEKNLIEQQAETLKTALAVFTGPPSEVCFLAKQVWVLHVVFCSVNPLSRL